ncbi:MAG: hypothetical protein CMN31_17335 [Sandaracinus sp.]|nr:hypothetical protein [Myxococcales bacterium]MBJ73074.1 hypothetical protein [Sandaracinus sp.]
MALGVALGACGDGGACEEPTLRILAPEDRTILGVRDDADPAVPGIQHAVAVEACGLEAEEVVLWLEAPHVSPFARVRLDEQGFGEAVVPLPVGEAVVRARSEDREVASEAVTLLVTLR